MRKTDKPTQTQSVDIRQYAERKIHEIMKAHGKTYDEAKQLEIGVIAGLIADDLVADRQPHKPWIDEYRYLTQSGK